MIPITRFLANVARVFRAGWPATIGASSFVAHPLRLARVIISGEARRRSNEKRLSIPIPRFCIISATWRCNLDCLGCYTKSYRPESQLPLGVIERVIREANRLGSFIFVIADALAKRFYEARPMALNIPPDEYATGECQAAGRGMIHVNADGNGEPCPFCHCAADNIREKPLREILASPFFAQIRSHLGHLPNPQGGCLLFTHSEKVQALAKKTGAFRTDRPEPA